MPFDPFFNTLAQRQLGPSIGGVRPMVRPNITGTQLPRTPSFQSGQSNDFSGAFRGGGSSSMPQGSGYGGTIMDSGYGGSGTWQDGMGRMRHGFASAAGGNGIGSVDPWAGKRFYSDPRK